MLLKRRGPLALVAAILFLAAFAAPAFCQELVFTDPPVLVRGHWHVPARPMGEWLRAAVTWEPSPASVTVTYRGESHSWGTVTGDLLIRRGRAFLPIGGLCQAFGFSVTLRKEEPILDLRAGGQYAAIPVGWRLPRLPRGLSREERQIWRLLVKLGKPWTVPGLIDRPYDIRVVSGWGSARLHPLNGVTDDVTVLLEKREGRWRIITLGTDVGVERNYGVPATVLKRLRIPA